MTSRHSIAVIAGDGIGNEVVPAAIECLEKIGGIHGLELDFVSFDWGSDYYRQHGRMMPADGLDQLAPARSHLPGRRGLPGHPRRGDALGTADSHPP